VDSGGSSSSISSYQPSGTEERYGEGARPSRSTLEPCLQDDPYASAFVSEPMQCWRMVHDRQLQATHCPEEPTGIGAPNAVACRDSQLKDR
jgi:O-methyltransferase involved in polyketide biosynthesis